MSIDDARKRLLEACATLRRLAGKAETGEDVLLAIRLTKDRLNDTMAYFGHVPIEVVARD